MSGAQATRVRVASFAALAPSAAIRVDVEAAGREHRIAVVRIVDDLYAIGDRCSHADVSLAEGMVWEDSCELECIKHGSAFSLRTGQPSTLPATKPVPVYDVEREGDDVYVLIASAAGDSLEGRTK
jgi:3-phenylpropionate/trans-cinnamate dioxygenase ferredoxin component